MIAWLAGSAAATTVEALLAAGITSQATIDDTSAAGYWAALQLHRRGFRYYTSAAGVTFTRDRR